MGNKKDKPNIATHEGESVAETIEKNFDSELRYRTDPILLRRVSLGCGAKVTPGYAGVDVIDYGQEVVGDAIEFLHQTKSNQLEAILIEHCLEHFTVAHARILLNEAWHALDFGGIMKIVVPSYKKESAYVLSHLSFYSRQTFIKLADSEFVKTYGMKIWHVKEVVENDRLDIHALLQKPTRDELEAAE